MIELLAPARDAEVGIEAFRHGADAVYIGAPMFSARAAAGNSVADIARLAAFGHQFGAKTIVAFNTILRDDELPQAERLAWQLYEAGVDALIVQDLGLLALNLPPIPLHASTQTDNRTVAKTKLMHDLGLTRVVMARELSVADIAQIHEAVPDVELECFVHGALCVSVSGQCYLSAALTGRSANRGECAQPCRLPVDMLDEQGRTLISQKHLLSLRDMNRSQYVEQLIAAGVTSLKIEGRLKDASYVKNVVAYYRQLIDEILTRHPEWQSASLGHCSYTFRPKLDRSFNRGFTSYFANGDREPMWNFDSPKSMGEELCVIRSVSRDSFVLDGAALGPKGVELHNGDGLVALQRGESSVGFRANRIEGDRVWPLGGAEVCRQLKSGMLLYRNADQQFDQVLSRPSAQRRIAVDMSLSVSSEALTLTVSDAPDAATTSLPAVEVSLSVKGPFDVAQRPQTEVYRRQLSKLGDSIFQLNSFSITGEDGWFVPGSMLNQLRRDTLLQLVEERLRQGEIVRQSFQRPDYQQKAAQLDATPILPADYRANVLNLNARQLYRLLGVHNVGEAFEHQHVGNETVAFTRHCLRYAFGCCPRYPLNQTDLRQAKLLLKGHKLPEQITLQIGSKKFFIKFGCKNLCYSEIIPIFAPQ